MDIVASRESTSIFLDESAHVVEKSDSKHVPLTVHETVDSNLKMSEPKGWPIIHGRGKVFGERERGRK